VKNPPCEGYLLLNKQPGQTSFQSLYQIKKAFNTSRVGHAGALDKFAQGLLIVAIGKATKLIQYFMNLDKQYEAILRFGIETDTLDPSGSVVATRPLPDIVHLEKAIQECIGAQEQVPPAYSAIHVQGERASERMRKGLPVDLEPRTVTIHHIQLVSYDGERAILRIQCSKGTYIRSLARDIAYKAGSCSHVEALTRTGIGDFQLSDALTIEDDKKSDSCVINKALRPIDPLLFKYLGIPSLTISDSVALSIYNGKPLPEALSKQVQCVHTSAVALFNTAENLVAVVNKNNEGFLRTMVFKIPCK
jgi:tRNA pseudouridine55 synthase